MKCLAIFCKKKVRKRKCESNCGCNGNQTNWSKQRIPMRHHPHLRSQVRQTATFSWTVNVTCTASDGHTVHSFLYGFQNKCCTDVNSFSCVKSYWIFDHLSWVELDSTVIESVRTGLCWIWKADPKWWSVVFPAIVFIKFVSLCGCTQYWVTLLSHRVEK